VRIAGACHGLATRRPIRSVANSFNGTVIGRQLLISIRHLQAAFRPSASNTIAGVNDVQGCAVRSP
jgi:hypothetical protein